MASGSAPSSLNQPRRRWFLPVVVLLMLGLYWKVCLLRPVLIPLPVIAFGRDGAEEEEEDEDEVL